MRKRYLHLALFLASSAAVSSVLADDLVVITNPAAGPLTKAEVAEIFLGRNPTFTPIDLPESSATYAEFYKKATGRDIAQVKAVWSRLVFSGKAQAPKQLANSEAVKKAVAADPKAIGYIEKSAVDGSVKVAVPVE